MSIYGTPVVKVETDITDRIGIRTLVLSKMWQPSSSTLTQNQLDAEAPQVPEVDQTILLLVGQQNRPYGGCYKTTWTFEGVNSGVNVGSSGAAYNQTSAMPGKTVTFKDRSHSFDFGFDSGFAQVPIQTHPFFQQMIAQFGGYPDPSSGQVIWTAFMPSGTANAGAGMPGGAAASGTQKSNPLFGRQDFLSLDGQYHHHYAELKLPDDLFDGAGTIFATKDLPGVPPTIADPSKDSVNGRNWLKVPPTYKRRGLIYEIMETYWLSWAGGWPVALYSAPNASGTWSV